MNIHIDQQPYCEDAQAAGEVLIELLVVKLEGSGVAPLALQDGRCVISRLDLGKHFQKIVRIPVTVR
jgi:hypothetical protein